jgi:hypothetical protein
MSKWGKLLGYLRLGAAIAEAEGVKVKGVPIGKIAEEAEKDGAVIAGSVKQFKPKPPPSSPGD